MPRRRRDAEPEESLTSQIFIGGEDANPTDAPAPDSGEATQMMSFEDLRSVAHEAHDTDPGAGPVVAPATASGPVIAPAVGSGGGWGPGGPVGPPVVPAPAPQGAPGPSGGRKKERMPAAAIVFVVMAALVVVSIVAYIVVDSMSGDTEEQTATPAPPPAASSEGTGESSAASDTAATVESFASPSGNITCTIETERVRCEIANFDYTPATAKPDDCDIDNWGGVVVANADGAGYSCSEAPEAPAAKTLDYGESITAYGMTCTSAETGMSCASDESGKGFTLSKAKVDFTN